MATKGNKDWLEEIASNAKVDAKRVTSILEAKGIHPSPVIGFPHRLTIRRIAFYGYKTNSEESQNIEFDWDGLTTGLWAMVSERNLRGKTSIMRIVQWMLRGRVPETLRSDVRKWINRCDIRFNLDSTTYELEAITEGIVNGSLYRLDNHDRINLARFNGDSDFEATMSDFFMRGFGLDALPQWRCGADEEGGRTVIHGWPSLSGAMFIGTNYSVLLGDIPSESGMTPALMRMYLGLPWVSTLMAAKTVQREVEQAQEARERRRKSGKANRENRRNEILAQLEPKRRQRDATPDDQELRSKIVARQADFGVERKALLEFEKALEQADASLKQAELAHTSDRKELRAYEDAEAAGAVFRMLDPSCCPRCDAAVTNERRKREQEIHSCFVCGETLESDEEAATLRAEMESRVQASKAAYNKIHKDREASARALSTAQARVLAMGEEVDQLNSRLSSFGERHKLDLEVAILEARLEEASIDPVPSNEDLNADEAKVLKATVNVAEKKVKEVQDQLLAKVSKEIVRYAKQFGMTNLTEATLKGNAHLHVVTGGQETTYGKCTEGEKLRLKVATVLAMIRVAESHGVGRHPGLLMIDSPGAQEIARQDLDALISGLEEATKEFKHLQVFIASMFSSEVLRHVPEARMRYAVGEAYLW